ncbi:MAG: response regulator transcription factor [Zoogloeaceae bacterium]|jgi:two-component system response regulator AlgR|nr:response regulator transcription factor [Zoogloeaceae bacterium]
MSLPQSPPVKVPPLALFIVEDEDLARNRLKELLEDIADECPTRLLGEASNGVHALSRLEALRAQWRVDVVLLDIHMPVMDGLELAGHLARLPLPPAIIFTTAYDSYAVQAFEVNAIDYLLKPVRARRLLSALEKARHRQNMLDRSLADELGKILRGGGRTHLACHERGRLLLVPVADVLYFKADLKYVTARTRLREYVLDETLNHLEEEYPETFLRLHRAILVARRTLAGFERNTLDEGDAYGWALLRDIPEKLPVSRRQWSIAKASATEVK